MPIRVNLNGLFGAGVASTALPAVIVEGLAWATNQGNIPILNMSFGSDVEDFSVEMRSRTLFSPERLLVAAMAAMETPRRSIRRRIRPVLLGQRPLWERIALDGHASGWGDCHGLGSNLGSWIDLAAPGGRWIATTRLRGLHGDSNPYYDFNPCVPCSTANAFGGTSTAAPVVSGVSALVLGANSNLLGGDIQQVLIRTARDVTVPAQGWDQETGWGLVRADDALKFVTPNKTVFHNAQVGMSDITTTNTTISPMWPASPTAPIRRDVTRCGKQSRSTFVSDPAGGAGCGAPALGAANATSFDGLVDLPWSLISGVTSADAPWIRMSTRSLAPRVSCWAGIGAVWPGPGRGQRDRSRRHRPWTGGHALGGPGKTTPASWIAPATRQPHRQGNRTTFDTALRRSRKRTSRAQLDSGERGGVGRFPVPSDHGSAVMRPITSPSRRATRPQLVGYEQRDDGMTNTGTSSQTVVAEWHASESSHFAEPSSLPLNRDP